MAEKLERKVMEIYGENAATRDIIAYGSDIAGNIVETKDPNVIQTEAYKTGVRSAVVGNNSTTLQNRQALDFLFSRQLKYLFQKGIPEWKDTETYYNGSFVSDGNGKIYCSKVDDNIGNDLEDKTKWKEFTPGGGGLPIGAVYYSGFSTATQNPGALPLFTGETISNAEEIYPEFYAAILADTGLQCTSAEYESSLTTYGECAKYVIGGGSLRLPLIKNYIKAANTAEGIKNIEAGLPNITGYASPRKDGYAGGGLAGGAFWLTSDTESAGHPATENGPGTRINFDASRSSAVYGKSSTVTPASTTLYPWVVAYAAAIPASTAQAAEFQNALSGKADVDLNNITSLGKKSSVSWIMPDYSRGVATGLAGHPTSALTNSYTCPTDGWILMQASKETSGNTLHFYVNGKIKLQFPAFSACYGNTMYPVGKGDVVYLLTDSTSATWVVNWCDFIPCKGA